VRRLHSVAFSDGSDMSLLERVSQFTISNPDFVAALFVVIFVALNALGYL